MTDSVTEYLFLVIYTHSPHVFWAVLSTRFSIIVAYLNMNLPCGLKVVFKKCLINCDASAQLVCTLYPQIYQESLNVQINP